MRRVAAGREFRKALNRPNIPGGDDETARKQGKGGQQCFAPTYACRPPGVHHGPFTSRGGCILHENHYYDAQDRR